MEAGRMRRSVLMGSVIAIAIQAIAWTGPLLARRCSRSLGLLCVLCP